MSSSNLRFVALDQHTESNIIKPTEKSNGSNGWYAWGDGNRYPDYLLDLYRECPTLHTIINGTRDYIAGNGSTIDGKVTVNGAGDTPSAIVRSLAFSYATYGAFALNVIRDHIGNVAEVYALDPRYIRTNKDCNVFWVSDKWGRGGKTTRYPAYMAGTNNNPEHASSILYVKDAEFQVYPSPIYAAAVKEAETERRIGDYHLNNISNGFMGSYLINMNNGIAEAEIMDEVERTFTDKFCGSNNAGRVAFSWNADRDHAVTLQKLEVSDYGDKYETLAKHCRQQLFTSFRANPNLFGISTESSGFNSEEYESAFQLFNRTMVKPAQKLIIDAFARVGWTLTIVPFTIEEGGAA